MNINNNIEYLSELCKDCGKPDWDSYGADPVTVEKTKIMAQILELFHKHGIDFSTDVIVPCNDGRIELELSTKVREEYAFVYYDKGRGGYHFTYGVVGGGLDKTEPAVISLWTEDYKDINPEVIKLIKEKGYK